jgi:hypothetical protein
VRQLNVGNDDSKDKDQQPAAPPLCPGLPVQLSPGSDYGSDDEVILRSVDMQASAEQAPTAVQGPAARGTPGDTHAPTMRRPVRATRNTAPQYACVAQRQQVQCTATGTGAGCVRGIQGLLEPRQSAAQAQQDATGRSCAKQGKPWPGIMGGTQGTLGLDCRRFPMSSGELAPGKGRRPFAEIACQTTGAKHRLKAVKVQAKCRWRRAANNTVRSETAYKGSSHGHTDRGAGKQGRRARHQRARQT